MIVTVKHLGNGSLVTRLNFQGGDPGTGVLYLPAPTPLPTRGTHCLSISALSFQLTAGRLQFISFSPYSCYCPFPPQKLKWSLQSKSDQALEWLPNSLIYKCKFFPWSSKPCKIWLLAILPTSFPASLFFFFFHSTSASLPFLLCQNTIPGLHKPQGFSTCCFCSWKAFLPDIYLMPCFFIQTLFKWSFLKEAAADHLSKVIPFSLLTGLILLYFSLLTFITGLKQGIYLFTYLSPFSIIWLH